MTKKVNNSGKKCFENIFKRLKIFEIVNYLLIFFFFIDYCSQNDTKLIWNSKTKKNEELSKTEKKRERSDSGKSMSLAAEECEEMEFKFRQKRSRKEQYTEAILKKNKREES